MKSVTIKYSDCGVVIKKKFKIKEADKGLKRIINIHKATQNIKLISFSGHALTLIVLTNALAKATV